MLWKAFGRTLTGPHDRNVVTATRMIGNAGRSGRALYHGGVPGLMPGETLLPPRLTGARSCANLDAQHCRSDRVYVTTDFEEAVVYAALAPPVGNGDVYEVEPLAELEPDPPDVTVANSYATPLAIVVAVVRRGVPLADALARMRMFVATLEETPECVRRGGDVTVAPLPFLALARHTE